MGTFTGMFCRGTQRLGTQKPGGRTQKTQSKVKIEVLKTQPGKVTTTESRQCYKGTNAGHMLSWKSPWLLPRLPAATTGPGLARPTASAAAALLLPWASPARCEACCVIWQTTALARRPACVGSGARDISGCCAHIDAVAVQVCPGRLAGVRASMAAAPTAPNVACNAGATNTSSQPATQTNNQAAAHHHVVRQLAHRIVPPGGPQPAALPLPQQQPILQYRAAAAAAAGIEAAAAERPEGAGEVAGAAAAAGAALAHRRMRRAAALQQARQRRGVKVGQQLSLHQPFQLARRGCSFGRPTQPLPRPAGGKRAQALVNIFGCSKSTCCMCCALQADAEAG